MTPEREQAYRHKLREALEVGYTCLENGQSATDAVETALDSLRGIKTDQPWS